MVGLDPARLASYPHELSGGMRQRAVIAMALALDPALIIADEPVTALDVIVRAQVLETLRTLQERLALSVVMITHDIAVVAHTCDSVAVMYAGKIVERGTTRQIFTSPYHPYTLGLQHAYPNLARPKDTLVSIEGYPPDLVNPPTGCRFAPRCPFAMDICSREEPPPVEVEPGHVAACHQTDNIEDLRSRAKQVETWQHVPTP
jgi:oligopeptide/dipeptide ABC transporter ATP-binding protein